MANDTHDLENVLDGLDEAARKADAELTVGDAIDAFAARSFGALLTMVALVAALPVIGAVPGVSVATGALVILIAIQFLAGKRRPWAPERLRSLSVDAGTMRDVVRRMRPYAAWIDRFIRPRLTFLTDGPVQQTVIALAAIALALLFFPAALIPGAVWAPALSVMLLGLALLGNDGVLALLGAAFAAGSIALVVGLL